MTEFLIRSFIKNPEDTRSTAARTAYGNLASVVGVVCNVLLFAGKLGVGLLFGSIAIMADAVNNLSDASSNLVTLAGFRLAAKPADEKHPYGYARYEYLAGLAVSAIIMGIGGSLLKESVVKILRPEPVGFSVLTLLVLLASIGIKLWMSRFNSTVGERIRSETLLASAADSRNDVISTGAVLVSTLLCRVTGIDRIDGIVGVAVAGFILYSGWGLVQETLSPLLGESPDPELVEYIERKVMSYPGVMGVHDLMVHDYGPGQQFASLHVEMPAESDPLESHDLIDNIEFSFLKEDHLLLTIHYDPIVTTDPVVGRLRSRLDEAVKGLGEGISMHDLRIVPGPTHTNVLFDLVLPAGYPGDKKEIVKAVRKIVTSCDASYIPVIKVEQSYAARG